LLRSKYKITKLSPIAIDSLGVGHCCDLIILLNDECKLESLQEDGNRTRQEIPKAACCKARPCKCFW